MSAYVIIYNKIQKCLKQVWLKFVLVLVGKFKENTSCSVKPT